jgi:predicted Zn-dependent protease with MMP-like domain
MSPGRCANCYPKKATRLDWAKIQELAQAEVQATLNALPEPLREKAAAVPVAFDRRPSRSQRRDGIEADTLGLFTGPEFADEERTLWPVPPRIFLFLENLWAEGQGDEELFTAEVHTTFLHELGHYLGLDEDGLIERGLE